MSTSPLFCVGNTASKKLKKYGRFSVSFHQRQRICASTSPSPDTANESGISEGIVRDPSLFFAYIEEVAFGNRLRTTHNDSS